MKKISADNSSDKIGLQEFIRHREEFCDLMFAAVKNGEFNLEPARKVQIILDKPRTAFRFEWPEKFLLSHFAQILNAESEKMLSDSVYSYRTGRSQFEALKRTADFLKNSTEPIYILRQDVRKYTDRIDHQTLLNDFKKMSDDSRLADLLEKICKFKYLDDGEIKINEEGLPAGTYVNVCFMNLYLVPLDTALSALPNSFYIRFGDDLFFACKDFAVMQRAEELTKSFLKERHLELSSEKTGRIIFGKPHWKSTALAKKDGLSFAASIEYLGMNLRHDGGVTLPKRKLRAIRSYIIRHLLFCQRSLVNENFSVRLQAYISAVQNILERDSILKDSPLKAYLHEITDTKQLREMDLWLALFVLKLLGAKGFKKGNFRLLSFKELRRAGLPSFVHLRRTNVV